MPLTLCRILGKIVISHVKHITLRQSQVFAFIFSFSVSQVDAEQFSHWFRIYRSTLLDYAGEKCKDNYTRMDWPQYGEDPHIEKIDNCKNMASCLLKNLNDFDKADMQSASVLLGLMPTALSYIGPTISELALLFSRRPVLVTLMVIGAPVISVTRLFDFTSLEAPLNHHEWPFHRHVKSKARAGWIIFIQYFFIAGAVAMSLENSVFLGRMTILSWKCLYSLMPFWWNLMSLVILLVAALARWVSKVSDCKPSMRIHWLKKTVHRPLRTVLARKRTFVNTMLSRGFKRTNQNGITANSGHQYINPGCGTTTSLTKQEKQSVCIGLQLYLYLFIGFLEP